jgi:DNA-binding NarL/FixJ family response regulator
MINIVLIDDHPIIRSGMKLVLESLISEEIEIIDFENGKSFIAIFETLPIDIVFLDIHMPEMNGFEVCKQIKAFDESIKVIFLSMYKDKKIVEKVFDVGANGFLVKDNSISEIIECLKQVNEGKIYLSTEIEFTDNSDFKIILDDEDLKQKIDSLTDQELKVLNFIREKFTSTEIAKKLYITPKSVENYRNRICKKLEIEKKNNSLLMWVLENQDILIKYMH